MLRQLTISLFLIFSLISCNRTSRIETSEEVNTQNMAREGKKEFFLLYPSSVDLKFHPHSVFLEESENKSLFIKELVESLFKEIPEEPLSNPFLEGSEVRAVYLLDDRSAVLDLNSKVVSDGGVENEMFKLYGIINSINYNFPQIERFKVIVDGQERETFIGHIDTSDFIPPEKSMNSEPIK